MTTHLVTFSDESMSRARDLCIESAIRNGIDERNVDPWSDGDFFTELPDYDKFLSTRPEDPRRAIGWWSWKPAIIDKNLNGSWTKDGDIVIYADAGVELIAPISHIIDRMDQDIFLFGNNWEHKHWCKADVVHEIWPQLRVTDEQRLARLVELEQAGRTDILEAVDAILKGEVSDEVLHDILWHQFGKQVQASVIFFRVSDYTRAFVKEWLDWCLFEGGRLIDDSPSRLPNHPEFREHRHDQAILTTMAYREGIRLHYWPGVYLPNDRAYEKWDCYASDDYERLFRHHRRRNHEWK